MVEGIQEITTEYIGIQTVLSADGGHTGYWRSVLDRQSARHLLLRYPPPLRDPRVPYRFIARRKGQWKRQALLHASNAGHADGFGSSISLSADGNTLAVGARGEDGSTNSASAEPGQDNDDAL